MECHFNKARLLLEIKQSEDGTGDISLIVSIVIEECVLPGSGEEHRSI